MTEPSSLRLWILLLAAIFLGSICAFGTDRPIIGILAIPSCIPGDNPNGDGQCIVASYVKHVEMAGARVAIIPYDLKTDALVELLSKLNGVVLTGGDTVLHPDTTWFQSMLMILNFTLSSNAQGRVYPLFGICQGFEAIAVALAGPSQSILSSFSSVDVSLPLDFVHTYESLMFPKGNDEASIVYEILASEPVTYNSHSLGISIQDFESKLSNQLRLISTNKDINGKTFVSSFEAVDVPVFGVQFHPEKNLFEWNSETAISHSANAIIASQYFANLFVNLARKSDRSFPNVSDENSNLIYNYAPFDTGKSGSKFNQVYYFK